MVSPVERVKPAGRLRLAIQSRPSLLEFRRSHLQVEPMNVTLEIPDDVAERLTAAGEDHRALEALVLEEYSGINSWQK